jgi:UDP-glucose 4-epimerase
MTPYDEAYGEGFEDMYRRVPDIAKVQALIGWRPSRSLESIVRDVAAHQRHLASPRTPVMPLAV